MKININIDLLDIFKTLRSKKMKMIDGEDEEKPNRSNPMIPDRADTETMYINPNDISRIEKDKLRDITAQHVPENTHLK
ncbi:MAG: hypothetical protein IPM48_14975 [Saprospiraceae bacterium]|nr:hypothetical protein [Saprospiraceae bacterium]